jgi:hypothetical protein
MAAAAQKAARSRVRNFGLIDCLLVQSLLS